MNKKLLVLLLISVLCIPVVFAEEEVKYEAYPLDANILSDGLIAVNFELPVVTIDGHTYVPLREAAEKVDMDITWFPYGYADHTPCIMLKKRKIPLNKLNYDMAAVFEKLIGFALPDTAEILDYRYLIMYEDEHFSCKASFQERDLEYIKNAVRDWTMYGADTPDMLQVILSNLNYDYDWWELSDINESIFNRAKVKKGNAAMTISIYLFITEGENGAYYLYVRS